MREIFGLLSLSCLVFLLGCTTDAEDGTGKRSRQKAAAGQVSEEATSQDGVSGTPRSASPNWSENDELLVLELAALLDFEDERIEDLRATMQTNKSGLAELASFIRTLSPKTRAYLRRHWWPLAASGEERLAQLTFKLGMTDAMGRKLESLNFVDPNGEVLELLTVPVGLMTQLMVVATYEGSSRARNVTEVASFSSGATGVVFGEINGSLTAVQKLSEQLLTVSLGKLTVNTLISARDGLEENYGVDFVNIDDEVVSSVPAGFSVRARLLVHMSDYSGASVITYEVVPEEVRSSDQVIFSDNRHSLPGVFHSLSPGTYNFVVLPRAGMEPLETTFRVSDPIAVSLAFSGARVQYSGVYSSLYSQGVGCPIQSEVVSAEQVNWYFLGEKLPATLKLKKSMSDCTIVDLSLNDSQVSLSPNVLSYAGGGVVAASPGKHAVKATVDGLMSLNSLTVETREQRLSEIVLNGQAEIDLPCPKETSGWASDAPRLQDNGPVSSLRLEVLLVWADCYTEIFSTEQQRLGMDFALASPSDFVSFSEGDKFLLELSPERGSDSFEVVLDVTYDFRDRCGAADTACLLSATGAKAVTVTIPGIHGPEEVPNRDKLEDAVFGLVGQRCLACHAAGGQVPDLSSVEKLRSRADDVLSVLGNDTMPPDGAKLSAGDKQLFQDWRQTLP